MWPLGDEIECEQDQDYDSLEVSHNACPVTPINYWWNCTEGVWWPYYFGSDIWLKDEIWEASLLGFQSCFLKTWYLEEVPASVPWWIASWELLSAFCPASFRVLFCSLVRSAADTHLKLLDRAVSGARFLPGGVFECDISHRRSVAVLCMLYKTRCNPVHPLNGGLPILYVPVRVTRGALVAHQYTYAPPRCRTLQYSRAFIPFSVSLWNDLAIRWCGTGGFQDQGRSFFIGLSCSIPTIVFHSFSLSLLCVYRLVLWGWGLRTDRMYITLSQRCTAYLF